MRFALHDDTYNNMKAFPVKPLGREAGRMSEFRNSLTFCANILRRCLRRSMWEMRVIRKIKDSLRKNNITLNYAMPSSLETNQRSTGEWKLKTSIQL